MAYNITSSSQLIDIATITRGCTQIEAAADKFEQCAALVLNASNECNADALSVDKTTMQPQLEADAEYIKSMKTAIYNFTLEIKNVALQVYAAQEAELNAYRAQQQAQQNSNGNGTP